MGDGRAYIAATWVAVDVALVFSFAWFVLNETWRHGRENSVGLLAGLALLVYFSGALMSRVWALINLKILIEIFDGAEWYVWYPLSVVGAFLGLAGAMVCVWIFAPRPVRIWLFALTVGTALTIGHFL